MKDTPRAMKALRSCIFFAALCGAMLFAVPVSAAKHSTVLNGQNYKYVYDYNYYTTKTHPELAGKPDKTVLSYFVFTGMLKQEQAIASFNVRSYRFGNQDLRKAFGMDYKSYYLHYQNYGHNEASRRSTATGVTKLKNPVTTYEGFNYKKVYNYEYYCSKYPAVAKKYVNDDVSMLRYFVTKGMSLQHQAIKTFNVKSYRYGNADLRVKFKLNYAKYYRHYCSNGYKNRKSTATGITSLKNIITSYNGVNYSKIYNFKYYVSHNSVASKFKDDDASAIEHFIKKGLVMRLQAKAGVTPRSKAYLNVLLKLYPNATKNEYVKANKYSSKTKYLILLDQGKYTVHIFKGAQYSWEKIATYPCVVGRPSSPTPVGVYTIGSRGQYFVTHSGNTKCWYYTQIYGTILFHSQIYDMSNSPVRLVDGSMSVAVSLGCVRLHLPNALWINQNIPRGTTVVIYNRPW